MAAVEAGVGFEETNVAVTAKLREWLAATAATEVGLLRAANDGDWVELAKAVGTMLMDMSRLDEAEPLLVDSLAVRRETSTLGSAHAETLSSVSALSLLLKRQGKPADAEPLSREALRASRQTLGDRHAFTQACVSNHATILQDHGKLAEAEPLCREALRVERRTLGDRHASTLASVNNLMALLHAQGKLAEAEPLCRESLRVQRDTLGERHADTLTSMSSLAQLLQDQGNLGEAIPLSQEALRVHRVVLGDRHEDTVHTMNSLAGFLRDQGELAEAELLWREALRVQREVLGERHATTLTLIGNLAVLLQDQGKLAEAEPLYREALRVQRETLGNQHATTLAYMMFLANLLEKLGKLKEAIPLSEECLRSCLAAGVREGAEAVAPSLLKLLDEHGPAERMEAVAALCVEHGLQLPPRVTLTADGVAICCTHGFGPADQISTDCGPAVFADPPHADDELKNAAAVCGRVALARRGQCTFSAKAAATADAGATALVVINSTDEVFSPGRDGSRYRIHVVGVSASDGERLACASEVVVVVVRV